MKKYIAFLFFSFPLSAGLCRYHIKQVEKDLGIPPHTLAAIGHVESGKYCAYRKHKEAWPWTVYAKGKGHFFQTKTQAQHFIDHLLKEGETNIDIGCMQINWQYHHKKFNSVSDMLHPRKNVMFAGQLLKSHYAETKNWEEAVGNYHSKTPKHHHKYRQQIELAHQDIKKQATQRPSLAPRFKPWRPVPFIREKKFFALQENRAERNVRWMR